VFKGDVNADASKRNNTCTFRMIFQGCTYISCAHTCMRNVKQQKKKRLPFLTISFSTFTKIALAHLPKDLHLLPRPQLLMIAYLGDHAYSALERPVEEAVTFASHMNQGKM